MKRLVSSFFNMVAVAVCFDHVFVVFFPPAASDVVRIAEEWLAFVPRRMCCCCCPSKAFSPHVLPGDLATKLRNVEASSAGLNAWPTLRPDCLLACRGCLGLLPPFPLSGKV